MNVISTQYSLATKSLEIYLAGCSANPHCEGCYSPETWDFDAGENEKACFRTKIDEKKLQFRALIDKIWILGGDPLDQNPDEMLDFVQHLKKPIGGRSVPIWLFTRHEPFSLYGQMKHEYAAWKKILLLCDYVKTGSYIPHFAVDDYIVNGVRLATVNQKLWRRLCEDADTWQMVN